MKLKGAVIVITGGGSGIGRATALAFAEKGAQVIVCGRRKKPLIETAGLIKEKGGNALAISADVRIWSEIIGMIDTALGRFGKIDVLVNNAGVIVKKPVMETTEEEWDQTLDTDLKGVFLCCKAVLPSMIKAHNGAIVNVSSTLGKAGTADLGAYCASKFGVIGLTQSLAKELEPQSIRTYAVCPGATYTALHGKVVGDKNAKSAMPPEKIAEKIIGVVTREISLPSGGSITVDDKSPCLTPRQVNKSRRPRLVVRSFKLISILFCRIKSLIR